MIGADGYTVFDYDQGVADWARAAHAEGLKVLAQGGERRHGGTWFVGVDALPNASDGSVAGVPLTGPWLDYVTPPDHWHRAQLSVIFPRYPQRDPQESVAASKFRRNRDAAHVDGLLPEGPDKRRHLREPHGFIAGFPLNDEFASPLVVWQGSHRIIRAAFAHAFAGIAPKDWGDQDVTEVYQTARRRVFDECPRIAVSAKPGQVILLDRHLVHGVAPWAVDAVGEMRMIAYFRPQTTYEAWLG